MPADVLLVLVFLAAAALSLALRLWYRRFDRPDWAFALGGLLHLVVWIGAGLVVSVNFARMGLVLWAQEALPSLLFGSLLFACALATFAVLMLQVGSWVWLDRYGPNGEAAWREAINRGRAIRAAAKAKLAA